MINVSPRTIERCRNIIEEGNSLLIWIDKRGNIDAHDLWYNKASKFLAVNCPGYERKLGQVAPKYNERLLQEHNQRAVYECISEQIEVVESALDNLQETKDILSNSLHSIFERLNDSKNEDPYYSELLTTVSETKITYDNQCWMACVALCGKILEISLKLVLSKHSISYNPKAMIGQLIAKIESENIQLEPGLPEIARIINISRIGAIHSKNETIGINQCRMVVSATLHQMERVILNSNL